MKPLTPNTLLQNRYLLVHLIGKGGMGEVYLAVDQRLGSAVAVKRTFFSENADLGKAFEREARTLARLRHPVLPKVSDHFIENENQYLVMDHISGDDLSKRLESTEKPFPLTWVLFWADQLLEALFYLHSHEPPIIHRDIKPQNLKLTDENHIVLLDFGLSKNSLGETRISSSGSVGYTPNYAPMEQIRGTGTNPRSDLYSLSTTLYQLLTNIVPPDALTRADALLNNSSDPIQPLDELNAEVTKEISDVILKGMAVSLEQRYPGAREMQKALRDAYALMQKAAAQPSASVSSSGFVPEPIDPQGITERISAPQKKQPSFQSESKTQVMPSDSEASTDSVSEQVDFAETLAFDSKEPDLPVKQSGIETVVLTNDFSEESEPAKEETSVTNFAEDVPMPLILANEQNDEIETIIAPSGNFQTAEEAKAVPVLPVENDLQPQIQKPQQEKKSGGKVLAIVGGLAALLFLVVAAAGIGWYFYSNSAVTVPEAPPPAVSPTPTPEEIISDTNTNNESNTNTQQEITNTEIPANTPTSEPANQPNAVKSSPRKSDATPRQTPKSTPKKNNRTDILQ